MLMKVSLLNPYKSKGLLLSFIYVLTFEWRWGREVSLKGSNKQHPFFHGSVLNQLINSIKHMEDENIISLLTKIL